MKTCKNPYLRKIGLNLTNLFLIKISKNDTALLQLLFRANEREALGRRILIMLYLLEGYTEESVIESIKCGFTTINDVKRSLQIYTGDKKVLLQNLRELYYSQFPDNKKYSVSPKTSLAVMRIVGLEKEPVLPRDRKVKLL